ncbi:hypothetical protein GUJ93_ZPchr0014g47681 [Zizania palustris]|uniref:Uncharacterized protein n=1 Tax=Zizania palustris TaxID=103762 RepID=A0A8J5VUY2_ZIZPA|nr:hypothetical protein GUJ93_ZPchr0014g47681 [Zizania palustris]
MQERGGDLSERRATGKPRRRIAAPLGHRSTRLSACSSEVVRRLGKQLRNGEAYHARSNQVSAGEEGPGGVVLWCTPPWRSGNDLDRADRRSYFTGRHDDDAVVPAKMTALQ